jgi:ribosomal-protein-alanine N-acetyltransferase
MARAAKTAPILETERLRLRPFRAGDLKALHALYADAENLRWWGTDPSPSLEETWRMMRCRVAYHPFQYVLWAVEEKTGNRLIGMINYHRRDRRERRVEVGLDHGRRPPGQGLDDRSGAGAARLPDRPAEDPQGRGVDPAREQAVG